MVVGAAVWYCALVQGVRSAQARLDVDVAAAVAYVSSSHTVSAEHSRLLLAVPAAVWYSRAVHVVWLAQTRLDVDVAAVVSCCSAPHSVSASAVDAVREHALGLARRRSGQATCKRRLDQLQL